jgi:hypothetical protein
MTNGSNPFDDDRSIEEELQGEGCCFWLSRCWGWISGDNNKSKYEELG